MSHRILVTRPAAQADELAGLLRARGLTPVVVPTVAIDATSFDGAPGLALRLRRDGESECTVVTGPRFPAQAPVVLDAAGHPVPGGEWAPDRFLVDLVGKAS